MKIKVGNIFERPGFNYYIDCMTKLKAKRLPRKFKKKLKNKSKPHQYRITYIEKSTFGMNVATLKPK